MKLKKAHLFFFSLFTFLATPLLASAVEPNFGNWTGIFLQGKFSDKWGWYAESQVRQHDGWDYANSRPDTLQTKGNRLLVRPALRYMPWGDGRLQFHLGYGWTPNLSPFRDENRLWQQVLRQEDNDNQWWALRFRFEERNIEGAEGIQYRTRYMGRYTKYVAENKKIGLGAWDELFIGVNTVKNGPLSGFDQNRIFVGPNFLLSPKSRLEVGYMNVYYRQGASRDNLMSHLWTVYVYLDW